MEFSDGEIRIKVLDSVEAIRQEGEAMHHCVFTNEYYLKADSLILSATIDGKRIETIEVSLNAWRSCRAVACVTRIPHTTGKY